MHSGMEKCPILDNTKSVSISAQQAQYVEQNVGRRRWSNIDPFRAGTVFIRQNLASKDVIVPELGGFYLC